MEKLSERESKLIRSLRMKKNRDASGLFVAQLECPSDCLALLRIPAAQALRQLKGLVVALDEVQNPGNIGTIIRLCDWLGIGTLLMSRGCADPYGAKVVQSTAGALGALTIHYDIDLAATLTDFDGPIIAADLDGKPIGQAATPRCSSATRGTVSVPR